MEAKNYISQNALNLTRKFKFRSLEGKFVENKNKRITHECILPVAAYAFWPRWKSFFRNSDFLRPQNEFPGFERRKSRSLGQKAEVRGPNWRENGFVVQVLRLRRLSEVHCPQ